jgi:anti-sigma regulatory factor (Ser/Thr protein kinase)
MIDEHTPIALMGSTTVTMEQAPRATAGDGIGARYEAAARLAGPRHTRVAVPPSHHGHDVEHWPLRDTLILAATESAVPSARAHLRQLLSAWDQEQVGPDAGVVVSELVTNSVVASAGLRPTVAPVVVWLGSGDHCVLVAVADASPRRPVRLNLEPHAERGRGLALVEALSSRWGWHPADITGLRKVTWAEWHLPAEPGQRPATGLPDRCHAV